MDIYHRVFDWDFKVLKHKVNLEDTLQGIAPEDKIDDLLIGTVSELRLQVRSLAHKNDLDTDEGEDILARYQAACAYHAARTNHDGDYNRIFYIMTSTQDPRANAKMLRHLLDTFDDAIEKGYTHFHSLLEKEELSGRDTLFLNRYQDLIYQKIAAYNSLFTNNTLAEETITLSAPIKGAVLDAIEQYERVSAKVKEKLAA